MRFKNRSFWIAAAIAFVLDQVTKYWVWNTFALKQSRPIISGVFHLTYVRNTGAAFSLFSGQVEWLRWLSLAVSVGLIAVALFGPSLSRWEQWGCGFLLGGAMGNGIDRFLFGYVVDFLHFTLINFPVFNLADVFINIGIACLLIANFQKTPSTNRRAK